MHYETKTVLAALLGLTSTMFFPTSRFLDYTFNAIQIAPPTDL